MNKMAFSASMGMAGKISISPMKHYSASETSDDEEEDRSTSADSISQSDHGPHEQMKRDRDGDRDNEQKINIRIQCTVPAAENIHKLHIPRPQKSDSNVLNIPMSRSPSVPSMFDTDIDSLPPPPTAQHPNSEHVPGNRRRSRAKYKHNTQRMQMREEEYSLQSAGTNCKSEGVAAVPLSSQQTVTRDHNTLNKEEQDKYMAFQREPGCQASPTMTSIKPENTRIGNGVAVTRHVKYASIPSVPPLPTPTQSHDHSQPVTAQKSNAMYSPQMKYLIPPHSAKSDNSDYIQVEMEHEHSMQMNDALHMSHGEESKSETFEYHQYQIYQQTKLRNKLNKSIHRYLHNHSDEELDEEEEMPATTTVFVHQISDTCNSLQLPGITEQSEMKYPRGHCKYRQSDANSRRSASGQQLPETEEDYDDDEEEEEEQCVSLKNDVV